MNTDILESEMWMQKTIRLAAENAASGKGGPFACLIVKDGQLVASGTNVVTAINDPTAHAEVVAIRNACREIGSFQLTGCVLYTSCEPCPMCLGAIYWARPEAVYFAGSKADAADAGFDDQFIYDEIAQPPETRSIRFQKILGAEALLPFKIWKEKANRREY